MTALAFGGIIGFFGANGEAPALELEASTLSAANCDVKASEPSDAPRPQKKLRRCNICHEDCMGIHLE
ncbi:hypothetical protein RISK_003666 [Rhodopirellula islandica]|uniref:Uncharacterized protein n=1 Tax=Rhodopirellula islandica TaxID=595434 RepID=A0A0J1BBQ9_RHOIS|nr:hypothetical protein RISK_003666 [Rhodopirellula islandica]